MTGDDKGGEGAQPIQKVWTSDKSYYVLEDQPMNGISDEALMAFVDWCRMNHGKFVYDPVLVRRVFDAYALTPDLKDLNP